VVFHSAKRLPEQLRGWFTNKFADQPVLTGMPGETSSMLRAILDAARAEWINEVSGEAKARERREKSDFLKYIDSSGAGFDFHGFRHTYVSTLVNSGVSVKVVQELARHSTPR
jgi:hypothetical protein